MRRSRFWLLLVALGASGCASAPPPAPAAPSYERKLGWILRLEDQRIIRDQAPPVAPVAPRRTAAAAPAAPPPDLVPLLRDSDARIRRRAAIAIGRVGLPDGVSPLIVVLRDPDPDVRQAACFGLGLLQDARANAPLIALLEDADLRVRGRAAEALGLIGAREAAAPISAMVAREATDAAVTGLAADDMTYPMAPAADALRLGLNALVRLKAWDGLASAVLDAKGVSRLRWWPVAYALQRIEDKRAVPALIAFARGTGADALGFAARGLGVLKEPRGVEVLVPLLDPARQELRVVAAAARALGQIGSREAIPPLRKLLPHPRLDTGTRVEVISALGALQAAETLDDLLDLLGHPAVAVRGAALIALARVDREAFLTALSGLDPDPAWQVRADLAAALGGLERERAVPRLTELLADADARVVAAALRALATAKATNLAQTLHEQLTRDDAGVRATAASLVGETKPAGGDAWLRDAWQRAKTDPLSLVRAAVVPAIARYGIEAATLVLTDALADTDWAIRLAATRTWRQLAPTASVPSIRPAPARLASAAHESAELTAPAYSPQVYLDTKKGTVQVALFVLDAPLTCANFVELARKGFFNGVVFHRVVPNFVVQGGDPRGDGEGGPGYSIRDELNDQPYLRGTVGMALDGPESGGSQFFITHGPQPHLDARYTVFGRVVAGMDVVDRLEKWDVIERVRVWDGVHPPSH